MSLHTVVQTVNLTLDGKKVGWLNSGMDISPGEGLVVTASGAIKYGGSSNNWGFPEGSYEDTSGNSHALDLGSVRDFADVDADQNKFPVSNVPPFSLSMLLLPPNANPVYSNNGVSDAIYIPREFTGDPLAGSYFGGAPRLRAWFVFNDVIGQYGNNSGAYNLTLQRYADTPQELPAVRGGRTVPNALMAHLRSQTQHPAWCWVVTPKHGPREFYTSLDIPLDLPSYTSVKGESDVPAATYLNGFGVDLTTIPVTLKIETSGTDVTVLYFERAKLLGGYYFGAEIQVFEVDWSDTSAGRWVAFSGLFGNAVVGDLGATLELSTWDVAFETARAHTVTYSCTHRFTEGLCRNEAAGDGPVSSDWTRTGEIVAVGAPTLLRVAMDAGFVTNGARELANYPNPTDRLAAWADRLGEGRLTSGAGSTNEGFARQVKLSSALGGDMYDLEMRESFPRMPQVGDAIALRSGCVKSPEMCDLYHNLLNYGGFPFLPLAEGMRRI